MAEESRDSKENEWVDKIVRPELGALTKEELESFGGLHDVLRAASTVAQTQKAELEALLDVLAQAESDLVVFEHDRRLTYEQIQSLAKIEKTLRDIQYLMNETGSQNTEVRARIQEAVEGVEKVFEEKEKK